MVIFRQGPPLTGASNADEVGRIAGYRSWLLEVMRLTVVGAAVYNSYGARLFTAETATYQ